ILLRKWADYGIRYGEKQEIGETVVLEVEAAYPDERLEEIINRSEQGKSNVEERKRKVTLDDFNVEEWEKRFQLIDQMPDPDVS
ncbi:virulence factor, partial [Escherichia coli]|uniref:virulence factor n=1 Tax=Escherichia coli TaxID=562 RepID=UPI001CCFDAF3